MFNFLETAKKFHEKRMFVESSTDLSLRVMNINWTSCVNKLSYNNSVSATLGNIIVQWQCDIKNYNVGDVLPSDVIPIKVV